MAAPVPPVIRRQGEAEMKRMLALVCGVISLLVVLSACNAAAASNPPPSVSVSCDDFQKLATPAVVTEDVTLNTSDSITVSLCENMSTGFSWEAAKISDSAVLQQVDQKSEPPATEAAGAAGQHVWTFKALKQGKSVVSIDYSRPWQGGEKGVWKFVLNVEVK